MRCALALMFLFVVLACAERPDASASTSEKSAASEVPQIEALYERWRTAVRSSDIPGYLNVLHPDVRLLPPGAPAIQGAANYGQFLEPVFATATYEIIVERAPVVEVVGDAAIAEYDYTIVLNQKNPDVGVTEPGAMTATRTSARYFDVLRRLDNGSWRVWRHSWQEKQE